MYLFIPIKKYIIQVLFSKENRVGQSVYSLNNYCDNSTQKSFFGHLKDETYIKECERFEDLHKKIYDYINYHNNYRAQLNFKKDDSC